jgi:hypothetical protein
MLGALLYLRLTSLKNLVVARVRRLRQPKYFIGFVVGAAYFYFVYFNGLNRHHGSPPGVVTPGPWMPTNTEPLMLALAGLALLVVATFMWVLPSQTPGLSFSAAETAFLFPAPISRRALIHYKLLSSQLTVLMQSVFFSLIFNSRGLASGRALQVVFGWWIILTLVNLHYTASSLTLARWFERGVSPARRRAYFFAGFAAVIAVTLILVWRDLKAPAAADIADFEAGTRWLVRVLDAGALHYLLLPFKWVVAPFFAHGLQAFLFSLAPAALLLLIHYFWVLNMEVSFEEASLALAEKRAARRDSLKSGDYRFGQPTRKARRAPFDLAETGFPEIAFLWKNLLSTRAFLNPRTWLICASVVVVGSRFINQLGPAEQRVVSAGGFVALVLGVYVLVFGPLLARLDLRSDLANADILKTYPLSGWRLVLGELLAPIAILSGIIWLALLVAVCAIQAPPHGFPDWLSPSLRLTYALSFAAITPILVTLQLLVPNAAAIVFPAWFQATRAVGGGIELMGQRMIFVFGQVLLIAVALLPAAGTAAVLIFVTQWLIGAMASVVFATFVVLAILIGEVWCALWWLGQRFERFDLSSEQRP